MHRPPENRLFERLARRGRLGVGQQPWPGRTEPAGGDDAEHGFALLEVVVAATLLVVSISAIASELGTQMLSISSVSKQQEADGLLDQAMEEVRALPYQIVANGLEHV